ncbi:hypothetical protein PsWM33_02465 [Pseudovibrio sp. WM33]|nr:hypothetical protein PsWM33_02465 [Pseudovibrio sp. WM33]
MPIHANVPRKSYSDPTAISLLTQVKSRCPLCQKSLFRKTAKQTRKAYELAHIYPLNPTLFERSLLKDAPTLNDDVNHADNLIPLCFDCHDGFDNPRTFSGYMELYHIKKALIKADQSVDTWMDYQLRQEISNIIISLAADVQPDERVDFNYDAKTIDSKIQSPFPRPLKQKIKGYVVEYYPLIRQLISNIDKENMEFSDVLSMQIKLFYLEQSKTCDDQSEIFDKIAGWIHFKTKASRLEYAEIIAAFFVQNCEIYE